MLRPRLEVPSYIGLECGKYIFLRVLLLNRRYAISCAASPFRLFLQISYEIIAAIRALPKPGLLRTETAARRIYVKREESKGREGG